jgi:hypothetical protein
MVLKVRRKRPMGSEKLRMVGYGSCDPWMGELQQQGAPGPEKKHSLSIYSPGYRVWA